MVLLYGVAAVRATVAHADSYTPIVSQYLTHLLCRHMLHLYCEWFYYMVQLLFVPAPSLDSCMSRSNTFALAICCTFILDFSLYSTAAVCAATNAREQGLYPTGTHKSFISAA